jgi:hypothetical protein
VKVPCGGYFPWVSVCRRSGLFRRGPVTALTPHNEVLSFDFHRDLAEHAVGGRRVARHVGEEIVFAPVGEGLAYPLR